VGGSGRHDRPRRLDRPILLRGLPPLAKEATTQKRDPEYAVTVVGLVLYVVVVAGVLLLLDIR
jgi:hypothetical protein